MNRWPALSLLLLCVGCSSKQVEQAPVLQKPSDHGNWFCEMAETKEDWSCVQSEELARHPKPRRMPQPLSKEAEDRNELPAPSALEEALDTQVESNRNREERSARKNASETQEAAHQSVRSIEKQEFEGVENENRQPASRSTTSTTATVDPPAYQKLAYQPDKPMRLVDLPAEFFAVQIVALSSKQALESYVKERNLIGMSAARVEKDGKLYYVLLLGIYQTRERAELAAADRPPPLKDIKPWIRRLGSLQTSMIKADKLAGSSDV